MGLEWDLVCGRTLIAYGRTSFRSRIRGFMRRIEERVAGWREDWRGWAAVRSVWEEREVMFTESKGISWEFKPVYLHYEVCRRDFRLIS